jgi:hypothetical protein
MWSEAEARRTRPTREKLAEALLDMRAVESKAKRDAKRWTRETALDSADIGGDLFGGAIEILGDVLGSIDF